MTIVSFHGNPGQSGDWDLIKQKLGSGVKWIHGEGGGFSEEKEIVFLAHSWGCYHTLKILPRYADRVKKVVLITPYLFSERPLSTLAIAVLKIPILNQVIIRKNHQKSWKIFLNDLLWPESSQNREVYQSVSRFLQNPNCWSGAVENKIKMQADPWREEDVMNVPIVALFGSEDKIMNSKLQMNIMKKYPQSQVEMIGGAGHGLLWSHADRVVQQLK